VTREWFEARREKLAATTGVPVAKVWSDPLTKKTFGSENTYKAYINSKKYKELVKESGQPAPQPIVRLRRMETAGNLESSSLAAFICLLYQVSARLSSWHWSWVKGILC
jgi:pre-60S factor REI1